MKGSISKKPAKKEAAKAVIGPQVAKELLRFLRTMREHEARSVDDVCFRRTEDVEAWEDLIRANVKTWRTAPREVMHLDSETTAALDEVCGFHGNEGFSKTDQALEGRRVFALRAIKAVCQAWTNNPRCVSKLSFAVSLREMTEEEQEAEHMAMKLDISNL